jgi:hypothetical protein
MLIDQTLIKTGTQGSWILTLLPQNWSNHVAWGINGAPCVQLCLTAALTRALKNYENKSSAKDSNNLLYLDAIFAVPRSNSSRFYSWAIWPDPSCHDASHSPLSIPTQQRITVSIDSIAQIMRWLYSSVNFTIRGHQITSLQALATSHLRYWWVGKNSDAAEPFLWFLLHRMRRSNYHRPEDLTGVITIGQRTCSHDRCSEIGFVVDRSCRN